MADQSPAAQGRELANQLSNILSAVDMEVLSREARLLVETVRRLAEQIRLDLRDHDYADTRAEQQAYAAKATKQLEKLQANIVKASEHDLFGPVDVALNSARIQQIISDIQ